MPLVAVTDNEPGIRRAKQLIEQIAETPDGLQQRLLLAAAVTSVASRPPIIVGGTAEEYWAGGEYHPTDLDLCPIPSREDNDKFRAIGLETDGRHWSADGLPVAVEFPGTGDDIEMTVPIKAGGVDVLIISREEIYLDRVRQATVGWPHEDISFDGALEIALTNFQQMDWTYVRSRIDRIPGGEANVREAMKAVNRRVRSRARRALAAR